ncbi:MAG: hypothetical protein EPO65_00810 [Dehalococcoidia bacterium]|nr:MAG: hypothetical protein EPO65_00810 [Dehalococcoidia bacterium]
MGARLRPLQQGCFGKGRSMSIGTTLEQRPAPASVGELRLLPHHMLHQHYRNLLTLSPDDLDARLREEVAAEVRLPADQRREVAYRRLSAWLDMDGEDARILSRAYDRAATGLSEELSRRRLEAERDAILNGLTFHDFRRLARFVPWLNAEQGVVLMAEVVDASAAVAA